MYNWTSTPINKYYIIYIWSIFKICNRHQSPYCSLSIYNIRADENNTCVTLSGPVNEAGRQEEQRKCEKEDTVSENN